MSLRRFTISTLAVFALGTATDAARGAENPAATVQAQRTEVQLDTSVPSPPAAKAPDEGMQGAPGAYGTGMRAVAPAPAGRIGYDDQGRPGHVHTVASADTLWDISESYLGTPWVWPSIWRDNRRIDNPHLIYPGDQIWINAYEMRRVTDAEAASLIANVPKHTQPAAAQDPVVTDLAPEPSSAPVPAVARFVRVSARNTSGLVTSAQLDASASIVASVPDRALLAQQDDVYVGLGEGSSEVGEEFSIVRTQDEVRDPDSGELLGYHVEILGWLDIKQVFPETSLATIRMSTGEIELEDRLIPRRLLPPQIPLQPSPGDVEGKISFFPQDRVLMGFNDFVYLNRGSLDGLEVGSPLDVYRLGFTASETSRGSERVAVPDRRVARMVVVRADARASVALVTTSDTELEIGDRFRGAR